MSFFSKIQNQPIYIRKIIVWSVTIAFVLGLAITWLFYARGKINEFSGEKFIEKINLPAIEIPDSGK